MEYIQGVDGQISSFMYSLGVGFFFGAVYDVVSALRFVLPGGRKVVFVTDVIYAVVCAFASFCFMLALNDGVMLLYILAAQLIGWIIERLSLGAAAKHFGHIFVEKLKTVFNAVKKAVMRPINFVKIKISSKKAKLREKRKPESNKNEKNTNFLLKKWRGMLYTFNRVICPKNRKDRKGKRRNGGQEADIQKKA